MKEKKRKYSYFRMFLKLVIEIMLDYICLKCVWYVTNKFIGPIRFIPYDRKINAS